MIDTLSDGQKDDMWHWLLWVYHFTFNRKRISCSKFNVCAPAPESPCPGKTVFILNPGPGPSTGTVPITKIWRVFVKYPSLLWFSYDFADHATNSNQVPISIAFFSSHDTSSLIVCYCSDGILGMRQKTAWTRDMARRVGSTTILF